MTRHRFGFSLIEVSIVLIIIGIISALSIEMFGARINNANYTNTKQRMETIAAALNRYYAANGRLPCPAQLHLQPGDAAYGMPIYSGGTPPDTGCDTANPANVTAIGDGNDTAPFPGGPPGSVGTVSIKTTIVSGEWIRLGGVPTRALGLSDEMMYDAFNRKFSYAMMQRFNTAATDGLIIISDGVSSTPVTTAAAFVLISHGRDGKGAFTRAGQIGNGCFSQAGLDNENCDDSNNDVFVETQFNDVERGSATWYDDLILWQDKNTVIGLKASTNNGLSIKFTSTVYKGTEPGSAANVDAICNAAYPGYAFCNLTDMATHGPVGGLPYAGTYYGVTGWINGGLNNCGGWNGGGNGESLIPANTGWTTQQVSCGNQQPIACCRGF